MLLKLQHFNLLSRDDFIKFDYISKKNAGAGTYPGGTESVVSIPTKLKGKLMKISASVSLYFIRQQIFSKGVIGIIEHSECESKWQLSYSNMQYLVFKCGAVTQ